MAIGLAAIGLSSPPRYRLVNVGLFLVAMRLAGELLDGSHYYDDNDFEDDDGDWKSVEHEDSKARS